MSAAHLQSNLPGALHAGVKAAPSRTKKYGKKRNQAYMERGRFWAEIKKHKTVEKLFEQYDVSKTGYLNVEEVAKFLQDAAKGEVPTEEEVNFVMRTTHQKTSGQGKGISMSEMKVALDVWRTWEQAKPEMEMFFKKFDTNGSNKLEQDQLKSFLKDLNEGHEPTDDEVAWVMSTVDGALEGVSATGGINRTELQGVVTLWYTHLEETAGGTPTAAPAGKEASACCVVS
mmetsp:Transcript_33439/g.48884  ORF Transcript_33439/g.48884 Transcript_33439/m.48884 type:complete len:229 (+) Transcript_33439:146-832(+)|eukprot:CAMPEP_0179427778 /NCGR_PEP_ID=MMETSP0799-20121207/13624_1 /TAXON_ID=46947 /ORGANISM="Geminigera cryophila, Strain CCMP2564" /LENGTH=228 /DNA_ID=CAMNT_0021202961 /DNA_START=162 /DNA_END=848 /DNA_ORIENTATION=+